MKSSVLFIYSEPAIEPIQAKKEKEKEGRTFFFKKGTRQMKKLHKSSTTISVCVCLCVCGAHNVNLRTLLAPKTPATISVY